MSSSSKMDTPSPNPGISHAGDRWPRVGAVRPATLKDGVGKVLGLAVVQVHGKPQLVAACDDNTLRYFTLDDEGKFGEASFVFHDATDWAKNEFAQSDPGRREARVHGEVVALAAREFDLLQFLADNAGLALSRQQLLDGVWGPGWYGDERTVDVHVRQLRRKLGDALPLTTVWGVGYRLG